MAKIAAIVYGERSGIVRRVVVTDEGAEGLAGHYGPGESILIVDAAEVVKFDPQKRRVVPTLDECRALVAERRRGKPAADPRTLAIDDASGEIERVLAADPALDSIPGRTLRSHPEAEVGWMKEAATEDFVEPVIVIRIPIGTLLPDGTLSKIARNVNSGGRRATLPPPAVAAAFKRDAL